ncbi:hypothetical protein JM93_02432 [Roseibium hamelinense]|uniref:tRNA threonylcarbamoyladenosine biosynthesis protein TsaE n=1 Tax=Roseibium hamelinense TaxID=150831 RepID=A0A562T129_9HYPH|nr:tRNA (adenosine(37)-N6)-threonylcarbamoyltransferase complex ATPase subunit type 1 TsaE [Roseibium hamelinense]MTI44566.1 tRNA (adenosine(37)-N6)-threonylcarbamoyltransferase complex ATPase subunit type 1 TsaE [Roseibium hamelinense]TWI87192.1 hypothetical protein JM93_02432 [Roseibium hamelinense]
MLPDTVLRTLDSPFITLKLPDEAATAELAEAISLFLSKDDLIALSGDLGAGKSTFSRALIRHLAEDPNLEVPSPTFTLVQSYDLPRLSVSHFDLYRLEEPDELTELGLEELLEEGAVLIEWPELGGDLLPANALWLQFAEIDGVRCVTMQSSEEDWSRRLQRTLSIRWFLTDSGFAGVERHYLAGDASTRRYERLVGDDVTSVLMDWNKPDGAAGTKEALSYNAKVHRAKDAQSVIAVTNELLRCSMPVPRILACDVTAGLVVQEDFGDERIADAGEPVPDRFVAAINLLAQFHAKSCTKAALPLGDGRTYQVPEYSRSALLTEAGLFFDWFLPEVSAKTVQREDRSRFDGILTRALEQAAIGETGLVLRDFHSPNILWRQERRGDERLGLIDYQDAVIGLLAYDVGSLLYDARVTVDEALENRLRNAYVATRKAHDKTFDVVAFEIALAVMSVQRILKILGIFYRLARRDNKPAYLAHVPRMTAYLDRVLKEPALREFNEWFRALKR